VVIGQNKTPTLVSSQHGEIESQQPEMTRQAPRCVRPHANSPLPRQSKPAALKSEKLGMFAPSEKEMRVLRVW
jgi:hypothetical protein